MLNLIYDDIEIFNKYKDTKYKPFYSIDTWFDSYYKKDWLNTDFSKTVIRSIDKSDHIKDNLIESPVLGAIPPTELSSGCKTVLMMRYFDIEKEYVWWGGSCGQNCAEWIYEVSKEKNITLLLPWLMRFNKVEPFNIIILKTGVMYNDDESLVRNLVKERMYYD